MSEIDTRGSQRATSIPTSPNGAGASSLQTLGAILRERREEAGISLADVEKATRIRQKYLAAIEADEWHLLPGEVVGRGFLRNYANFLKLDANQMIERRRAMADPTLARSLASTSAEAQLPPVRQVDYRPKDVDLEHTPLSARMSEYVDAGRDWFAPVATAVTVVLIILLLGWGLRQIGGQVADLFDTLQSRATVLLEQRKAGAGRGLDNPAVAAENSSDGAGGPLTPNGEGGAGNDQPPTGADQGGVAVAPTNTPTPPPTPTETPTSTPTETPIPLPTPTETPIPLPPAPPTPVPAVVVEEPTPTPEPVIVAPSCPDGRAVITSPGVDQTVSGVVPVTGSATHEQFQYYKLEFAPGADAQGGFVYFDGTAAPVQGGVLGNFNSTGVPNGVYTLMLTVVDVTGNYPPPCRVTVNVQN